LLLTVHLLLVSMFVLLCVCLQKFSIRVLIAKGKTQQLNFACAIGKRITATIEETVAAIVAKNKAAKAAAAQG
jgi:hypothetical protein